MQRTISVSLLQRKILLQLDSTAAEATRKRDDFLAVVLAGHDIETGHVTSLADEGLIVEVPDAPIPPTDGAEG